MSYISNSLPLQYREYSWVCSYSLVRDGKVMQHCIKSKDIQILIIKDSAHIWGGRRRGNICIFIRTESRFSNGRKNFMMLNEKWVVAALLQSVDLHEGTSDSVGFDSPPLSSPSENSDEILDVRTFTCVDLPSGHLNSM